MKRSPTPSVRNFLTETTHPRVGNRWCRPDHLKKLRMLLCSYSNNNDESALWAWLSSLTYTVCPPLAKSEEDILTALLREGVGELAAAA